MLSQKKLELLEGFSAIQIPRKVTGMSEVLTNPTVTIKKVLWWALTVSLSLTKRAPPVLGKKLPTLDTQQLFLKEGEEPVTRHKTGGGGLGTCRTLNAIFS